MRRRPDNMDAVSRRREARSRPTAPAGAIAAEGSTMSASRMRRDIAQKREPKLLERVGRAIRARQMSRRTEKAYRLWIRRYIFFHGKRHPKDMAEAEVNAFLTHLAADRHVSPSTQTQALCALNFLYKVVLDKPLGELEDLVRAKRTRKMPVVLTQREARLILDRLRGLNRLFMTLLYGTGMRLMEGLRLRVKDVDFEYEQITVRDGKGRKDRVTMLPATLKPNLQSHLKRVKALHDQDLARGGGRVYLPYALERKYPRAASEWIWQYVFPAPKLSLDPRSGERRRHHLYERTLQRAFKRAVKASGITKRATIHTLRSASA